MDPLLIGLIVFVCIVGGTVLGVVLGAALPERHFTPEAKDVIKVSIALIGTMSALVLGLLTASAKSGLDAEEEAIRAAAVNIVLLDRTLAMYGPEATDIRALIRDSLAAKIATVWPEERDQVAVAQIAEGSGTEQVIRGLLALTPQTDAQRWLQSRALTLAAGTEADRWSVVERTAGSLHWVFLLVVVFWLVVVFVSFGLFAPRNASVAAALVVASLAVTGALFLIVEMAQPYGGLIKISATPLKAALAQLGRP